MKNNMIGRSMVEMLGVLAIVGVLSIGALAGYHKAISKYRLNKHKEQFSNIMLNVIDLAPKIGQVADSGLSYLLPYYLAFNFIDSSMLIGSTTAIEDTFKNRIDFYTYNSGSHSIGYRLSEGTLNIEICKNILEVLQELHSELSYFSIQTKDTDGKYPALFYFGDKDCGGASKCIKDIKVKDYLKICSTCKGSDGGHCDWFIDIPY
ncbi:MAG: hypothetical protein IJ830_02250 [Alphaproteobacteria bacterium]|nr:hypothetical protein [Alphaproteobacteria bacterium]